MLRGLGRAFWWVLAYERPASAGDYAAIFGLLLLLGLGALALSWPWFSTELARTLAAGLRVVEAAAAAWGRELAAALARSG
jgi:hypothetical protein